MFNSKMDADRFLESMIDSGEAIVKAGELRNLLQNYRKLKREIENLKQKNELLLIRNTSLKEEVELLKLKIINSNVDYVNGRVKVSNLDVTA